MITFTLSHSKEHNLFRNFSVLNCFRQRSTQIRSNSEFNYNSPEFAGNETMKGDKCKIKKLKPEPMTSLSKRHVANLMTQLSLYLGCHEKRRLVSKLDTFKRTHIQSIQRRL